MARRVMFDDAYVRSVVQGMRDSGSSAAEYARQNGIPASRMYASIAKCDAMMARPARVSPHPALVVTPFELSMEGGFQRLVIVFRATRGKEVKYCTTRVVMPYDTFLGGRFNKEVIGKLAEEIRGQLVEAYGYGRHLPRTEDIIEYCIRRWQ